MVRQDAPEMLLMVFMVLAVFLCLFHLLVSCHFMFAFLNFERNLHGATAKCIVLNVGGGFAASEMAFFTHIIYLFFLTWIFHRAGTSCCTGLQRN